MEFARQLLADLRCAKTDWPNNTLESYLEAIGGWTEDMDGYFQNRDGESPDQPTWSLLAKILLAARVYE